jgi:hypothetical protein
MVFPLGRGKKKTCLVVADWRGVLPSSNINQFLLSRASLYIRVIISRGKLNQIFIRSKKYRLACLYYRLSLKLSAPLLLFTKNKFFSYTVNYRM